MGEGAEGPDTGRREKEALDYRELQEQSAYHTSSSSPSTDNLLQRIEAASSMGEGAEGPDTGRREKEALDYRELQEQSAYHTSSSSPSTDNLLQRICRLDAVLAEMEEIAVPDRLRASQTKSIPTREHSSAPATPMSLNDHRRPTECVLEEVQRKGTLVERVSDLEKRYLQLQRALSTRSTEYTVNPNESHLTPTHLRVQSHDCGQQSIKDIINLEKHAVVFSHVSVGLVKGVEKNETVLENLKGLHVNNETGADCKLPATEGRYGESPSPAPPPLRKKRRGKLPKWISNHFRMPFRKTPQLERLSVI